MELGVRLLAPEVLLALVAVVIATGALVLRRLPAARQAALDRFARRVGLPVPDGLRARVERHLGALNLARDLGALAGVSAVTAWALVAGIPAVGRPVWLFVIAGAAIAGAACGAAVAVGVHATRADDDDGPRLARPTAPSLHDYLAPVELQGGRAAALMPTLVLAVATIVALVADTVGVDEVVAAGSVTAALLAVAALIGSEVAARKLITRPQPAGTVAELAWNDAIRAHALRAIVSTPIAAGTYATFGLLLMVGDAVGDEIAGGAMRGLVGVASVALTVALVILVAISRPQRHFRRRLWTQRSDATGDATP